MTKSEFNTAVTNGLKGLSKCDIEKSLDFYNEMINDRMEEGLSEEEAISAVGTPNEVTKAILMEIPIPKLVKAKSSSKLGKKSLAMILIIAGSPIWIPLLAALLAIILLLYVVIWSVAVSFWATDVAIGASAIGVAISAVASFVSGNAISGALLIGSALVLASLALIMVLLCKIITKLCAKASVGIIKCIRTIFIGGK